MMNWIYSTKIKSFIFISIYNVNKFFKMFILLIMMFFVLKMNFIEYEHMRYNENLCIFEKRIDHEKFNFLNFDALYKLLMTISI